MKKKTESRRLLFATIATATYIPQVKQLFAGAHEAGYWPGEYMVISPDISEEDRDWMEQRGILVRSYPYLMTEDEWPKYEPSKKFHRIIMEKYRLFQEEFKQWDVVVYMDCDIIITGPLVRLSGVKGFNAITDDYSVFLERQFQPASAPLLLQSGYSPDSVNFCSATFAFDTSIISPDTHKEILQISERFLNVALFPEQSILNLYFHKKWKAVSASYGYVLTLVPTTFLHNPKNAIALHFAQNSRPWEPASPYYQRWKDNLEKAETIDFRKPRHITTAVRLMAFWKEKRVTTIEIIFAARFVRKYKANPLYPIVRMIYRFAIKPKKVD